MAHARICDHFVLNDSFILEGRTALKLRMRLGVPPLPFFLLYFTLSPFYIDFYQIRKTGQLTPAGLKVKQIASNFIPQFFKDYMVVFHLIILFFEFFVYLT